MLFPTHLVAAYVVGRQWDLRVPLVVAGAALPDLVDKPAATLGVTDLFHTVGHSLLAVVFLGLLTLVYRSLFPLWVGWTSHLALDALHMVLNGRPADVQFLAWPFIRHTPAVNLPPLEFFEVYVGTPSFVAEFLIWGSFGYLLLRRRRSDTAQ